MEQKHTPGPYHVEQPTVMDLRVCSTADFTLATVSRFPMSADESLHTAMLFAAAPDLLYACEVAMRALTDEECASLTLGGLAVVALAQERLKLAIAKATGESA